MPNRSNSVFSSVSSASVHCRGVLDEARTRPCLRGGKFRFETSSPLFVKEGVSSRLFSFAPTSPSDPPPPLSTWETAEFKIPCKINVYGAERTDELGQKQGGGCLPSSPSQALCRRYDRTNLRTQLLPLPSGPNVFSRTTLCDDRSMLCPHTTYHS